MNGVLFFGAGAVMALLYLMHLRGQAGSFGGSGVHVLFWTFPVRFILLCLGLGGLCYVFPAMTLHTAAGVVAGRLGLLWLMGRR